MIAYKLRQEKTGGYLLERRKGAARQLTPAEFDLLLALWQAGQVPPGWPQAGIAAHFAAAVAAGWRWWQTLEASGLTTSEGLRALQFIPLPEPLAAAPDDCLAAPARIYFELTRRCNLACRTCFNESHAPLSAELTTAEIFDILAQLDRLGAFEIRFTGGEPTEHPDFRAIVSAARTHGFYVSLGTNGVYTAEKRAWIYDAGVDWFIVSLDGVESANDQVRGAGSYRQVLLTLQELAQQPAVRVRLNMVVGRHNVRSIPALAELADQYAVESLNLIPLRPYGRAAKTMTALMFNQRDFYAFIQQLPALRAQHRVQFITTLDLLDPTATTSHDPIVQKKRSCAAGIEAAVIGATGDVYGCSYSPASFPDSVDIEGRRLFVAGNLHTDSFHTIWRDSSRWAVFRYLEQYKNPRCQSCLHYSVRCVGSCPIMGYFQAQQPNACDPYCFVDLLPGVEREAV